MSKVVVEGVSKLYADERGPGVEVVISELPHCASAVEGKAWLADWQATLMSLGGRA